MLTEPINSGQLPVGSEQTGGRRLPGRCGLQAVKAAAGSLCAAHCARVQLAGPLTSVTRPHACCNLHIHQPGPY